MFTNFDKMLNNYEQAPLVDIEVFCVNETDGVRGEAMEDVPESINEQPLKPPAQKVEIRQTQGGYILPEDIESYRVEPDEDYEDTDSDDRSVYFTGFGLVIDESIVANCDIVWDQELSLHSKRGYRRI